MLKYILQRIVAAFFTFLIIVVVVFFVLHSMPGDIIDFSPKLDPNVRQMITDKYHLDDPADCSVRLYDVGLSAF